MTPITQQYQSTMEMQTTVRDPQSSVNDEFGRLIHAAVINHRFCEMLLANPLRSIEKGYCGESFHFPREYKNRLQLIEAGSLEEFSKQALQIFTTINVANPVSVSY
jgi:hypothetical protein